MGRLRVIRVTSLWALCALLLCGGAEAAVSVRVAIGDFTGRGASTKRIAAFQGALKRMGGIGIQSTSGFQQKAREMRLAGAVPDDPYALIDLTAAVDVDAVVYMEGRRPGRGRDIDLVLRVFAGRNGRMLGEHTIRVRRGRFTRGVWRKAARAVEADLYAAVEVAPAPPRRREPEPEPMPVIPIDPEPRPLPEPIPVASDLPMFRLSAGLSLLARSFDYQAAADSPQFADGGIQYESALVPGFVLDGEVYPFVGGGGALAGLGLGLRYEKVFVSTEQEVQLNDGSKKVQPLETSHDHLRLRALYRYALSGEPGGVELLGGVGFGLLAFEVAENDEYNGVNYTYLDLTVGGLVPLGTPLAALDVQLSLLPVISLGETVNELGAEASTFGYRIHAGIQSLFSGGVTASAGVEYSAMDSEITGSGRGGRKGKTASDAYVGLRLLAGYLF